jgi:23S rRNA (pseudouridine1915-N3)-methyltransferase
MRTRLIVVGRTERGFVAEGMEHYLERVRHWSPVEVVVLPKSERAKAAEQRLEEERAILKALPVGGRLVILDEVGVGLGSLAFAQKLGAWRDQGVRETTFVIGGAYGLTEGVRCRADLVLSLSPMTFPHQLVRVLFAEQLYRAWSVLNGSSYHH